MGLIPVVLASLGTPRWLLLPGGIFPWLWGGLGTPPTPQFPVGSHSCTQWGWLHQMF